LTGKSFHGLALYGGEPLRRKPFAAWPEYGPPEEAALARVLASGSWGGFPSPNTEARAFAEEFASYVGAAYAIPCANGTVSLTVALQAARVSPGAEVITTGYSFVATAAAIVAAGCVPVPVDILPDTYCLDPAAVEAALSERTEAILPVHLACAMADMDRLAQLAEQRGLLLLEDCAHSHGARWRDRGAGSIGHLGSFSMQSSKLLTAGEGGAVTTSDARFALRAQSLVNCGRKEPGSEGFPEQLMGQNLRMTEWQAAILREQLLRLPAQHLRRAARVALFEKEIVAVPGLRPLVRDARVTRPTAYQFILRYDADEFAGASRDAVVSALQAEGLPCSGRFYLPIDEDPLFSWDRLTNPLARSGRDFAGSELPVTRRAAYEEAIWLPHELFLGSEADVHDMVGIFAKVRAGAAALDEAGSPTRSKR
jgi:dTDP-4-amino-4,6-dideoxygalactose transaminase